MQTCTTPARRRVTRRVDAGRFSRFGLHLNGECGAPDTLDSRRALYAEFIVRRIRAARRQAQRRKSIARVVIASHRVARMRARWQAPRSNPSCHAKKEWIASLRSQ